MTSPQLARGSLRVRRPQIGGDWSRLQRLRLLLVRRLAELERERAQLVREGHSEKARRTLRAFQEVARLLEVVDELSGP